MAFAAQTNMAFAALDEPPIHSWQSLAHSGKLSRALDKEDLATPWIKKLRVRNLEPSPQPYTLRIAMPCTCGGCVAAHEMKPERCGATKKGLVMVWDETKQACKLEADKLSAVVAAAALAPASSAATSSEEPPPPVGSTTAELAGPPATGGGMAAAEDVARLGPPAARAVLEQVFAMDRFPTRQLRASLATDLAVSPRQLKKEEARAAAAMAATNALAAQEEAVEPAAPPVQEEAGGVRLHLSSSSSTGYESVRVHASGNFVATRYEHGTPVLIGLYDTPVEAARAEAASGEGGDEGEGEVPPDLPDSRKVHVAMPTEQPAEQAALPATPPTAPRPPQALARPAEALLATEAEGLRLHLSSNNSTGYRGVQRASTGRFQAKRSKRSVDGKEGPVLAASPWRAPLVTEAEGLRLHLSSSNSTGYRGLFHDRRASGRFQAQYRAGERRVSIGSFDTAVEAAVAYARAVGEYQPPTVAAAEAEGLRLHLSSSSSTGYKGVYESSGRFQARHMANGRRVNLGYFDTAVEAAVAYARAVGKAPAHGSSAVGSEALDSDEGESEDEEGEARCLWVACDRNSTGYLGVRKQVSGRFKARHKVDGKEVYIGGFGTAVEAAVAYARAVGEDGRLFELLPDGRTVHKEAPPNNGGMAAVAEALGRIGLQSYAAAFDSEGFDDIEFLLGLDSAERAAVATATGMDAKPGHAGKWVKFGFGGP
ncbi:hypothetical protein EMIHUDRAFT_241459 [Emiliania huxleyi CCMP1516]|uniref:AP2/ERF domain-containing protein n=2 Tax=Emiliania huxleyi TaxID=2903 RepID=A0A0D3JCN2_EMIH1|nr:hypothetical protein EMIHUDRAFT_241459 [Emiliania huxleyi CCMP1516]EOD21267.1 hypothetical protein EMIHUDRAFT_241459 [Emiliania huxleyi CCMP1516]|eukprot:XP_005773696.1 hypothetical protein EMIHUDRAFT_241459 [Emiliania huxleyi CCMP1516]